MSLTNRESTIETLKLVLFRLRDAKILKPETVNELIAVLRKKEGQ